MTDTPDTHGQPRAPGEILIDLSLQAGVVLAIWYLFLLLARWMGHPELAMAFGFVGLGYLAAKGTVALLPEEISVTAGKKMRFAALPLTVMIVVLARTFPTFIVPDALAAEVPLQELHQHLNDHAGAKLRVRGTVSDFTQGMRNPFEPGKPAMSTMTLAAGNATVDMHYDHDVDEMVPKIGDRVLVTGLVAIPKHGKMDLAYQARYGRATGRFLATDMKLLAPAGSER